MMKFKGLVLLVILYNSLLPARGGLINPADCKVVFYYGPDYSDSVSYPLAMASQVVAHPKFIHKKTALYIPDYHEPQLEEYHTHYLVDSYLRAGDVNMLFLDWGAPVVPDDQVKDPYLPALVPMTSDWMIQMHDLLDWKAFHVLAYAKGAEFISNVVRDMFRKTMYRIHRITQLAPPQELIVEGKQVNEEKDLITDFIDAIHTDIGNQGANVSRAHVDFYPNGGTAPQPGCPNEGLCSRRRSFLYYAESVNNPKAFCGHKANSHEDSKSEDSKEQDSKSEDSKEQDSKSEDSKEHDSKSEDSKEQDSKSKDSKEHDSKSKDSKEHDSKSKDSKEHHSKSEDSKEQDSKSNDSKEQADLVPMGRACPPSARGKYYLGTNADSPFGKGC